MRPLISKMLLGLAGAAGFGCAFYYYRDGSEPAGAPVEPVSQATNLVCVLGWIKPDGGIVEVAGVTGLRLIRLGEGVAEGREVDKGKILAYLEGYDERCRELDVIDAQIAEAEEALRDEKANEAAALAEVDAEAERARMLGGLKIEELRLRVEQIEKECGFARAQLRAVDGLQNDHTIAPAEYEKQRAAAERAEGELATARSEARRATEEFRQATSGAKLDEQRRRIRFAARRAVAAIPIGSLRKKRRLTEALMERSIVSAPLAGRILEIGVREGEAITGEPVVKLAPSGSMYVVAEVFEEQRRLVRNGQAAEATARGLPGSEPLRGTVDRVGLVVGGRKLMPLDPTSDANSHVFETWIKLDEGSSRRVRDLNLMNVDVRIDVDPAGEGKRPRIAEN
jgi:HlyD family secretion protein